MSHVLICYIPFVRQHCKTLPIARKEDSSTHSKHCHGARVLPRFSGAAGARIKFELFLSLLLGAAWCLRPHGQGITSSQRCAYGPLQSTGAQSKRRSRDSYSNRAYSRTQTVRNTCAYGLCDYTRRRASRFLTSWTLGPVSQTRVCKQVSYLLEWLVSNHHGDGCAHCKAKYCCLTTFLSLVDCFSNSIARQCLHALRSGLCNGFGHCHVEDLHGACLSLIHI